MSNKTKQELKIIGICILGLYFFTMPFAGILYRNVHETILSQDVFISSKDNYSFDCNARYIESNNTIACAERIISGEFSRHEENVLLSDGINYSITTEGDSFQKQLTEPIIPNELYENANFMPEAYLNKASHTTETLEIYNPTLDTFLFEKEIEIHWRFSKEDLALVKDRHDKWVSEHTKN